jgi:D-alanyl-D-alanine dipeptidase
MVELKWSPGHSKVEGNEKADEAAKEATKAEHNTRISQESQTFYKEYRNKKCSKDLKKTLKHSKATQFTKQYSKAYQPTDIFKEAKREPFSKAGQALMGHGYIGEYYARFNLPDTDP